MGIEHIQSRSSALGGDGWIPRLSSLRDERNGIWAGFGAFSECGRLRSVLLRRPGVEIERVCDIRQALWFDALEPDLARAQHDALTEAYRSHGVAVHYIDGQSYTQPNLYFIRDTFAMSPEGAIVARPASQVRAGEERIVAHALVQLGVPIVLSVHGSGVFEGADMMLVNEDLAFVASGLRTNDIGARQVEQFFRSIGVSQVVRVQLNEQCMHLDCGLSILDHDVALIDPVRAPRIVADVLRRHGFRVLTLPEHEHEMAINVVAIEPGLIVTPILHPSTRALLARMRVTCIEVDISELLKGGGGVHCMTGVIQRDSA